MLLRIAGVSLVLVLGAAATSCDGEPSSDPEARPTPVAPSPECPNHDEVVSDEGLRRPGSLVGDVTGDGSEEQITIVLDPGGGEECRAFLIVESSGDVHAVNIDQEGMFDMPPEFELPRLRMLAAIDERPGAEIVVDVLAGAATEFVAVFSMGSGMLERVEVSDDLAAADDVFAYGGSVGHLSGVDCTEDGLVVSSVAEPSEDRYAVERRFLRPESGTLVRDQSRDERHLLPFEELEERFREFRFAPFGSCG